MPYESPGRADALSDELLTAWNDVIARVFGDLGPRHTRFFSIDTDAFEDPAIVTNISWTGDPAEPTHCGEFDQATIRALSDWGAEGRHQLQNEYCEYAVIRRPDGSGRLRPKRVQITTELREYWLCLAVHDPVRLREIASATLHREVRWEELYGTDPGRLDAVGREARFAVEVAGNGGQRALVDKAVPGQPRGALNRENALFMTHPINGLDDLIYIVLFGARRFAIRTADGFGDAAIDDIFTDEGAKVLACRHADPRAATGAYDAVREGNRIGFANPLGMYLRGFDPNFLSFHDAPLPASWIRWGRGEEGMHQRLEVGPDDDDDAFLDDIVFSDDRGQEPLTGGHQLVGKIDVGPLIAAVATDPADEQEFHVVAKADRIDCAKTGVCTAVRALKQRFDAAEAAKPAPRVPPGG
jgi:hypothetical protein